MKGLIACHEGEYNSTPQVIAKAPGILNLMGEHTDYNKGCVVQTAIDRYTTVAVSARKDNSLRFFRSDMKERKKTTIPNLKYKKEDRWANCLKGVLLDMANLGLQLKGLDVTITSNITPGIGLGFSAALEVAFAFAVNSLFNFGLDKTQLMHIASYSEAVFLDKHKEITDQFTSTFGKKDQGLFLDLRSMDFKFLPVAFEDHQLVVVNSNIPGTEIVREAELRERMQQCEDCIDFLNTKKQGKTFRDYTLEDVNGGLGLLPEQIRRICIHVIGETQRAIDVVPAFINKDFELLGRIMNRSHESLRDNYEVSCPELDWLVKRSMELDYVVGSRMTGGGFGGCTVSLIKKGNLDNYKERLQDYEHIFGFVPEIFSCKSSSGVKIIYPK